jgi:hypothetical protein
LLRAGPPVFSTARGSTAYAFAGDPCSEPQGLNSVFDTDASTIAVIAQANQKLTAFG